MSHVRMEGKQQHMLQWQACNMHTLNIKIFAYIACYYNNVSLKLKNMVTFLSFVPNVASIDTPLSCPWYSIISFCHLVCMPFVKGMLLPCKFTSTWTLDS